MHNAMLCGTVDRENFQLSWLVRLELFYAATPHLIPSPSDICFDIGVLVPSFERTLLQPEGYGRCER
jgi:hypothetical protein